MRFLPSWYFRSSRRSKVLLLTLIGAAIVLIAFHQPLLDAWRGLRSTSLLSDSKRHAEDENWPEVERTAMASLQLRNSIEAVRLLLTAYEETDHPRILHLAIVVFSHPDSETADRIRGLRICLDDQDLLTGARMRRAIGEAELEDPEMRYQAVRFHLLSKQYREATEMVDALSPADRPPALELLLAQGLSRVPGNEARGPTAVRVARVLAGHDRTAALGALELLATLPDHWIHERLATAALERFEDDKALSASARLRLDLLRIGLNKERRGQVIEAAIERGRDRQLSELVEWLERLGEAKHIVELTDFRGPEKNRLTLALFQSRARALESLGHLEQLEKELQDPPAWIPEVPLLCTRAALAARQDKGSEAARYWQQAVKLADRDPNNNWFYLISDLANRVGNSDLGMEALARGIEGRLGRPPRAETLMPFFNWLYEQDDTERLLHISYRLLRREPGNPVLVNNYHYLKVLHGQATDRDLEAFRSLTKAFPEQPDFARSLAFALLNRGEPKEALEILDALQTDPTQRPKSELAIRASALVALGRHREASLLSPRLDWSVLSTREARVLKKIEK